MEASTVRSVVAKIRYFHLINGEPDFTPYAARIWALSKCVAKNDDANAKRPRIMELAEWICVNLAEKGASNSRLFSRRRFLAHPPLSGIGNR